MNISDEEWREFWKWILNKVRELRIQACKKYPRQTTALRKRQH